MAWTDEMVETLKILWDQGVSTGDIGKRLGITKNSVVGKVHRLKLDGRPSPIKRKEDKNVETKAVKETVVKEKASKKETAPKKEAVKVEKVQEKEVLTAPKPIKVEPVIEVKTKEIERTQFVPLKTKTIKDAPVKENCSLTQLGINSCRWPIGDPKDDNFHFCGKKVRPGQTYCDEHCAIAYVKIVKK